MTSKIKISPQLEYMINYHYEPMGCKDLESRHIFCNAAFANLVGLKHQNDVIGRLDSDMPCETADQATNFQEQDQHVILNKSQLRALDIHPFSSGWQAFIFTKIPLINEKNKDEIIGTIYHGRDLSNHKDILAAGNMLIKTKKESSRSDQISYQIASPDDPVYSALGGLTERQTAVLFLTVRGKNARQIALILDISTRTVETYLNRIKLAFSAQNRSELVDVAISSGFGNVIPTCLLNNQLSLILEA